MRRRAADRRRRSEAPSSRPEGVFVCLCAARVRPPRRGSPRFGRRAGCRLNASARGSRVSGVSSAFASRSSLFTFWLSVAVSGALLYLHTPRQEGCNLRVNESAPCPSVGVKSPSTAWYGITERSETTRATVMGRHVGDVIRISQRAVSHIALRTQRSEPKVKRH